MRYCVAIAVRSVLGWSDRELRHLTSAVVREDGKPGTVADVREWACDQIAQGHELYPVGECDNFDWKTGCKGHPDEGSVG